MAKMVNNLEKVRAVLENMDTLHGNKDKFFTECLLPKITLTDILEVAKISKEQYKAAECLQEGKGYNYEKNTPGNVG